MPALLDEKGHKQLNPVFFQAEEQGCQTSVENLCSLNAFRIWFGSLCHLVPKCLRWKPGLLSTHRLRATLMCKLSQKLSFSYPLSLSFKVSYKKQANFLCFQSLLSFFLYCENWLALELTLYMFASYLEELRIIPKSCTCTALIGRCISVGSHREKQQDS